MMTGQNFFRKKLLAGGAAGALSAILLAAVSVQAQELESAQHNPAGFAPVVENSSETADSVSAGSVAKIENRVLAASALSGIVASLFGIFGANRILQFIASLGVWLGSGARKTAKTTYKAAKSAAQATGRAGADLVRKPVRWVFLAASLTVFVFTGVAVFDLEWQAGLLTGAGVTGAAAYGFDRTRTAFRNVIKNLPFRRARADTAPA